MIRRPLRAMAYYAAYATSRCVSASVGRKIGLMASMAAHQLKRNERSGVEANLATVLKMDITSHQIKALARRVYVGFGQECVRLLYAQKDLSQCLDQIQVEGKQHLEMALSQHQGVILAGPHVGAWEMGAMHLAKKGYPITLLVDPPAVGVQRLYHKIRINCGLQVIEKKEVMTKVVRALRKGRVVAMLGDRRTTETTIQCCWFGRKTRLPQGVARLSWICQSPIVPAFLKFCQKQGTLVFHPPIFPPKQKTQDHLLEHHQRFADSMETVILQAPEAWYCFDRVWDEQDIEKNQSKE